MLQENTELDQENLPNSVAAKQKPKIFQGSQMLKEADTAYL